MYSCFSHPLRHIDILIMYIKPFCQRHTTSVVHLKMTSAGGNMSVRFLFSRQTFRLSKNAKNACQRGSSLFSQNLAGSCSGLFYWFENSSFDRLVEHSLYSSHCKSGALEVPDSPYTLRQRGTLQQKYGVRGNTKYTVTWSRGQLHNMF